MKMVKWAGVWERCKNSGANKKRPELLRVGRPNSPPPELLAGKNIPV
jgi:hypothetical protein